MTEQLLMRYVTYDSVELLPGIKEYSFFKDYDDIQGDKVNSVAEAQIIKWIFNNPYSSCSLDYLFYDELQLDSRLYSPHFEVTTPIIKYADQPGDIDILLIDQNCPQNSLAIQAKRVKCTIDEDDVAKLKTSHLKVGVSQATRMFNRYRFHKNYLMLILVSDTQYRKNDVQLFRNPSLQEKRVAYQYSGFGDLPEEVGIFVFEINQPSSNPINFTGNLASKTLRFARPIDQLNDTTDAIKQFLKLSK